MGLAAQALGRWPDADSFLREALAATSDPSMAQRRAVLEASLGEVNAHLGRLEVQCNVTGATVRVDGTERGAIPLREPLRLPAGTVTLQIGAAGYLAVTRQAVLTAGGTTREQIDLVAVPRPMEATAAPPAAGASNRAAPPPAEGGAIRVSPPPTVASGGTLRRAMAWTTGGVAVAGLALGTAALLLRNAAADTFNARNADANVRNDCPRGATGAACRTSSPACRPAARSRRRASSSAAPRRSPRRCCSSRSRRARRGLARACGRARSPRRARASRWPVRSRSSHAPAEHPARVASGGLGAGVRAGVHGAPLRRRGRRPPRR